MITRRKPAIDDKRIFGLIKKELLPVSKNPGKRIGWKDIRTRLNQGHTYVSRTKKGVCIGFIHLMEKGGILWIDMLAVHGRFQGRGIGKRLLQAADRFARKRGKGALSLFVDTGNRRAIRFYELAGYRTVRYVREVNCFRMDKVLIDAK